MLSAEYLVLGPKNERTRIVHFSFVGRKGLDRVQTFLQSDLTRTASRFLSFLPRNLPPVNLIPLPKSLLIPPSR